MNLHPTTQQHFHHNSIILRQRHLFFQYTLRYIRNNMISNTGDIPLLAGGYITLDTVKVSRRVDYGFMHCIIYSIRIAYTYLHYSNTFSIEYRHYWQSTD